VIRKLLPLVERPEDRVSGWRSKRGPTFFRLPVSRSDGTLLNALLDGLLAAGWRLVGGWLVHGSDISCWTGCWRVVGGWLAGGWRVVGGWLAGVCQYSHLCKLLQVSSILFSIIISSFEFNLFHLSSQTILKHLDIEAWSST